MAISRLWKGDSKNRIRKKGIRSNILKSCVELKGEYKDTKSQQEIKNWEEKIIPSTPLTSIAIDNLQTRFEAFKKQLAEDKLTADQKESEKKEAEKKAAEITAQQAKVDAEKASFAMTKARLLAQIEIPTPMEKSEPWQYFQAPLKNKPEPLALDFHVDAIDPRNTNFHFRKTFYDFYVLARKIEIDRNKLIHKISNLTVLSDETYLQVEVTSFQKRISPKLDMLLKYDALLQMQKKLMNDLEEAEGKLVPLYFSPLINADGRERDELAITVEGHYGNKQAISRQSILNEDISISPESLNLYNRFKTNRLLLLSRISSLEIKENSPETKEEKINDPILTMLIEHHKTAAAHLAKVFLEHTQYVNKKNTLKSNLKLNKNVVDDLKFWDQNTDRGWHGKGGVRTFFAKQEYRVPEGISNLMSVMNIDHVSNDAFQAQISQAQIRPTSFWLNCFRGTRSLAATRIYEAKNLDEVKIVEISRTPSIS